VLHSNFKIKQRGTTKLMRVIEPCLHNQQTRLQMRIASWLVRHHQLERAALEAIASSAGTGCTGSDCIISWNGLHWQLFHHHL
jgi:hypothetical protein